MGDTEMWINKVRLIAITNSFFLLKDFKSADRVGTTFYH